MNWSDISYEILLSVIDHCERNEKVQFNRLYGLGVLHRVIEATREIAIDEECCFSSVLVRKIGFDLGIDFGKVVLPTTSWLASRVRTEILARQHGLLVSAT